MNCPRCQHGAPPGAKFCAECGQPVAAGAESASRFDSPVAYTPKHLAEKILSSRDAVEGERKLVTVLFADLKGSMELLADRDPEDARKLLDAVLDRMMDAVHRYEGTVNQVMGDGIMALFGAPLAHEDHAVRACYAALGMQESVKRYADELHRSLGIPIHIRVGLNSGEVVVRSIGNDLRMDYTAVGQTTHLAARIEQMAMPGTILITPETLNLAEGYVVVKPLGARPVKGLETPLEVYEVTAAGAVHSRLHAAAVRGLTRFVGRDAELNQLRQAVERARTGHGQVVGLVGEAGVGKSRLYWEFTHSHRTDGCLILESRSVSYGKATPYLPVIESLKAYFKVEDHDDPRSIREKVTGKLLTLDEALKPLLPALLTLLSLPVEDPPWDALSPAERGRRTLEAVKRLVLRESQVQPVVMVFVDLHWIDSETQALLDSLIEGLPTARVLLLVNYRPEYQHGWGGKSYYTQLRIDPLPSERAEELLNDLVGDDPGLEPLKRLLIERTEGNPFFLEESVRTLVETRVMVGERRAYRLEKRVDSIQVPATVQAVLAARIDRLPQPVKHLLQSAAVIGKDVPFALLEAIAEQPEDDFRRGLTHLQAAEFLYEASLFPELEYTFKHALTLEVAYQSLVRDRRRILHGRVLGALERRFVDRMAEQTELLAHHAVRGEAWDRAAGYLYQAGEKARAQARYTAGARFFEATVDALDRLGDGADLTLKLDACLELWATRISTGQLQDLRELGEKAEALARRLDDGPHLAQVQVRQAQAIAVTEMIPGTLASAIEKAREAFDRADLGDLRTRSYARYVAGVACRDLGRFAEAISEFGAGIALFGAPERSNEDPGLVFPIYVSLGGWRSEAHAALGRFDEALGSATDALRMASEIRHPSSLSIASAYLGYAHAARGDAEAAVPCLERGLAVSREHDLIHGITANSLYLGYSLLLLGDRERGLECLARAFERPLGSFVLQWTRYRTVTAGAYLIAGEVETAAAEVSEGLAAATKRDARGYRAPLLRLQAEVFARRERGDHARALECLKEALELATELGLRPDCAHCHLGLGRLHRRTGKPEQAHEHLTTAATMYREMNMHYWLEKAETEMKAV
ncbi:MAG: AAA family ATPase [Candidatus Rokubacteria bacterium]|nr:AAA family ATPase [Candidatus Rokubacteria bacterium]